MDVKDILLGSEKILYKSDKEETNPSCGCWPDKRPIRQYLRYGFVILDKPRGPTSHEVVSWVKKILELSRTGHAGTLDPRVSGVLPVALEESTKALQALSRCDKEYVAVMKLHDDVPEDKLQEVIRMFIGPIYQKPPFRSAVKRRLRVRHVYNIDVLEKIGKYVVLRVRVEAGTYVRKLIHDIGEVLGVSANMRELRRTRVACFTESESVRLQELNEAYMLWKEFQYEDYIRQIVRPVEYMVKHLPKVWIRDSAVNAICYGAALAAPGVVKLTDNVQRGSLVALMTLKNELVALGEALVSSDEMLNMSRGIVVKTLRVIMDRDVYPRMWKSRSQEVKFL